MTVAAPPAITPRKVALLATTIAQGYAAAGVREEGGNNHGEQVEFFQRLMGGAPGDSWCADFVCTCLVKGYARARGLDESRASLPGYVNATRQLMLNLSASCIELAKSAKLHGLAFSSSSLALVGDLVLFDFKDEGDPHHVGFVLGQLSSGQLRTVEGNSTDPAHKGGTGGVYLHTRDRSQVYCFVRWPSQ